MNSKKLITLLVLTTLTLSIMPVTRVFAIAIDDTYETDGSALKSTGTKGQKVLVNGTDVTAGAMVNIYWDKVKTWDGAAGKVNETEANNDGSWSAWIKVPEAIYGMHYIWVKDSETGLTTSVDFSVEPKMSFSSSYGLPGDKITITGYGYSEEAVIKHVDFWNMTWPAPFDYNTTLSTTPTTPKTTALGTWSAYFKVPSDVSYGTFNITAFDEEGVALNKTFTVGASISLSVDSGPTGTVVEVTGRGMDPAGTIDQGDVTIDSVACYVVDEPIDIDNDGDAKFEIVIPSVGDTGEFDLVVNDGTNTPEASFEVTGEAELSLNPAYGVQGTKVTINGYNYTQIDGVDVDVYINGTFIKSFETDNDGFFSGSITIPAVASGTHVVWAEQPDYEINGTKNFRVGLMIVILSPNSGPSGTVATLTASGFTKNGEWNATFGDVTLFEDEVVEDDGTISEQFFIPTVEPDTYTVTIKDLDSEIEVLASFTVTHTTMIETDPLMAPNGYNVTIEGKYFSAEDGTDLDFVIFNATEDWDMSVTYGGSAVETDEDGNFTGYWEVLDEDDLGVGTYTINCTDDNNLIAQLEFRVVTKTTEIDPRKATFRIGDTVGFNVESSFAQKDSYIKIWDPDGELYWTTDDFIGASWQKVGTVQIVPFYKQTAGGNPMILLDDAPLGTWEWTWYDSGDDEIDSGVFNVEAAAADVLSEQVEDLNEAMADLTEDIATTAPSRRPTRPWRQPTQPSRQSTRQPHSREKPPKQPRTRRTPLRTPRTRRAD